MNSTINIQSISDASYMAPEGCFFSRFHSHDTGPDKNGEIKLRLRFELEVPNSNGIPFMAGRFINPILVEGSELYWFLKPWLDEEGLSEFIESGADFDKLLGTTGWVRIEHRYTGRPKPFVFLESVTAERPESDSITVNVPKLIKPVIPTTSTKTVTQGNSAVVPVPATQTANASACPYCGAELNRFGPAR